jgi:Kef-type K+ transport system membrane component KefB
MEQAWGDASVWIGLAFLASLIAHKTRTSVALVELCLGIGAGALIGPHLTPWVQFLSALGAVVLTFLAGAELEKEVLRRYWKESLAIGTASFLAPFLACGWAARFFLHWSSDAAWIAGIALSTTSVAVVYAVMLESGLNQEPIGKLILAACFVTDLGTVLTLSLRFSSLGWPFWTFAVLTAVALPIACRLASAVLRVFGGTHIGEPEAKYLWWVLAVFAWLAVRGGSEAVLPAYLAGVLLADTVQTHREFTRKVRSTVFGLLTPFYFLKAGVLVDVRSVWALRWIVVFLLVAKGIAKWTGVYPVARWFRFPSDVSAYTALLMSTGLTFGTIASLYGYNRHILSKAQYSVLVTAIILSAIVPTLVAQGLFGRRLTRRPAEVPSPSLTQSGLSGPAPQPEE